MRVRVDRERCIGAGECVRVAPAVFDQDGSGLVVMRAGDALSGQRAAVEEAEELCPSRAITLLPR